MRTTRIAGRDGRVVAFIGLALITVATGGCGFGGGDKAGGSNAPVVLRLGEVDGIGQPGEADARYFANQVGRLSGGRLRVDVVFDAAGQQVPAIEPRLVRMVRDGRYQLGWIGARGWDQLGVKSLQALQAPFLITDQKLLDKATTGPIGARMLSGLHAAGMQGLALVPSQLRYVFGLKHPFASLKDFAGAGVRVGPSNATDALIRALGSKPVHVPNATGGTPQQRASIQAREAGLTNEGGPWVTANEPLFGKALTLFADERWIARLSSAQRSVLRQAAAATARHAIVTATPEAQLIRAYCSSGRVATASASQLAALERAARPVYIQLERDRDTKALITAIRRLKVATPPAPVPAVPAGCTHEAAPASGAQQAPSSVNGTYRWVLTAQAARAFGPPAAGPGYPQVFTATLRDGKWLFDDPDRDNGTYKINGDRITFDWPRINVVLRFKFTDHRPTLTLKPVAPMERGDQFVWANRPWRRVGPPVTNIP
ncbi:MAG: hypothetical protein QOJ89_731 [bacterium]